MIYIYFKQMVLNHLTKLYIKFYHIFIFYYLYNINIYFFLNLFSNFSQNLIIIYKENTQSEHLKKF